MNNPTLKLRRVAIDTYHENVAYLHRECAVYRAEGFQALSKILISANGQRILAVLNVVDDFSREMVGQLVSVSISGRRVARFLDQLADHL